MEPSRRSLEYETIARRKSYWKSRLFETIMDFYGQGLLRKFFVKKRFTEKESRANNTVQKVAWEWGESKWTLVNLSTTLWGQRKKGAEPRMTSTLRFPGKMKFEYCTYAWFFPIDNFILNKRIILSITLVDNLSLRDAGTSLATINRGHDFLNLRPDCCPTWP